MIDAQTETTPLTPEEQHVRRAHLTVCLTLLALLAAAYLTTATLVADRLPQRVPVHFGVDGVADGWLDRWVALVAFGLLSLGLPLLLLVVFAVGQWWRGSSARFTSALVCAVAGIAYLWTTSEVGDRAADRARTAEMPLTFHVAVAMFIAFAVVSFSAGLTFNIVTIAIPKIVDERFAQDIPLMLIGSVATMVLLMGGVAQLTVGRLVSKYPPHLLFVAIGVMQLAGVVWSMYADGFALLAALAFAVAGIYAQVTVADVVIARYTADAWRGRVYSVRFFLAFISSGAAIGIISALHGRGGFFLVLGVTAICAVVFLLAAATVAALANRAESQAAVQVQPAE